MTDESTTWRRCSTCKQPIHFKAGYFACSVSTCSRKGTDFAFCSVNCWDAHVPTLRHRDAWADEKTAPSAQEWARQQESAARESAPSRPNAPAAAAKRGASMTATERPSPVATPSGPSSPHGDAVDPRDHSSRPDPSDRSLAGSVPREILIVVSKLKAYVRARSGLNTSDEVMETLSDRMRTLCDKAIAHAREDGRKTVMSRDFRNLP
jgi:hypothetical protein